MLGDLPGGDEIRARWRSHYQCLLKGVPQEQVKQDILDGKSITLCYPEYRVYSSAIVTGNIPYVAQGTYLKSPITNKIFVVINNYGQIIEDPC